MKRNHFENRTRPNALLSIAWLGAIVMVLALVGVLASCNSNPGSGTPASASLSSAGSFTLMSQRDTDGDGVIDLSDSDDDDDTIPDASDPDDDNDGIHDDHECDSDHDGVIDDHDDDYVEIHGTVSAVGTDSFVLFGYAIVVDGQTRYDSEHGQSFEFSDIAVGTRLEVEGIMMDNGDVLARKIDMESDRDDNGGDDDEDDDDSSHGGGDGEH